MSAWIISVALASLIAGVPDLTREQRLQLQTAEDRYPQFDRPAIFPLLRNALQWQTPVRRAGAMIPDYGSITRDPAAHRGALFLIEGDLARVVETGPLAQPGPWDGKLREWDVVVRREPQIETAVVFLADPPSAPKLASRVEIVARFYKLMRRRDVKYNRLNDFPVFVGRTGKVVHAARVTNSPSRGMIFVLLLLVLAFAGVYMVVRRSIRRDPVPVTRSPPDASIPNDVGPHAPILPPDAAAALDEMERRSRR